MSWVKKLFNNLVQHSSSAISLDDFLAANKEKYEIISDFQYQVNHISQESYQDVVSFVESNSDIFFRDYNSAMLFFEILEHFSLYNYWKLELILDLAVHFDEQMKKVNMGECEYFQITANFINSQNYLVAKKLITASTIAKYATRPETIINFYPEIESYDPKYAELLIQRIFTDEKNTRKINEYKSFFDLVRSNPEQHKINRLNNYHPSLLHKAIREDDISTFQQILSQSNINLNSTIQHSIYERTSTTDKNLSLIQTAALYGSLNIFKFLWMQSDIILDENLQFYSYSGRNLEIIHICEQKCSFKNVLQYAISTHQNDLVEYYLDNYQSQMNDDDDNEDDDTKYNEVLKKFEEDDQNPYKKFSYNDLNCIVFSLNFQLLIPCLPKIVFLIENYEINFPESPKKIPTLLVRSCKDFNLFKFLYSHKNPAFRFGNDLLRPYIFVIHNCNPSVLYFLLENENDINDIILCIFRYICTNCPDKIQLFLNFLSERKNAKYLKYIGNNLNADCFSNILHFYNEKTIIKFIKVFPKLLSNDSSSLRIFTIATSKSISVKMIYSLVKNLSEFLPQSTINSIIKGYEDLNIKISIQVD